MKQKFSTLLLSSFRSYSSNIPSVFKQVVYENYGNPNEVLKLRTTEFGLHSLKDNEVLIKWMASPINPSDLNQIQGIYPIKSKVFPAVGGNEGCGIVSVAGRGVKSLKPGDLVLSGSVIGCWCDYGVYDEKLLYLVDEGIPKVAAAILKVNPSTAYRMLHDFATLEPGDSVIQNGANSAVGQYVIQLCKIMGLKTINVVRDRPNITQLKHSLQIQGATHVFTEEEFANAANDVGGIKLALNCIGGRSSLLLARSLCNFGCMVTYGGMSMQPVQMTATSLIFNQISLRGFWMSKWYEDPKNFDERSRMHHTLAGYFKEGTLLPTVHKLNKLEDFKDAIKLSYESKDGKQIFEF